MKYRAICPSCSTKISRLLYFLGPSLPHRCKACSCTYRSQSLWEWTADFIAVALILPILFLAWHHHISWVLAVLWILFVFAIGYVLFPYITPFVLVKRGQDYDKKPSA